MKKRYGMIVMLVGIAQLLFAETSVEAIMHLDTEMPCLPYEKLSGRILIRNNGDDNIQLAGRVDDFLDMLIYFQLYLSANVSVQEIRTFYAGDERSLEGDPSRSTIKRCIDSWIQRNENIMTLKKSETLGVEFSKLEIKESALLRHAGYSRKRIPFKAELYLSPDKWIPVEVHPPIEIAYDAKFTPLTPIETGPEWDRTSVRLTRVQIGTNEFLHAKLNSAVPFLRLADLHPDDVVIHSNKVITITQKNGTVRTIPEADIPRISAERAEESRKARRRETNN